MTNQRIAEIKAQVTAGTYLTPEKLCIAAGRMLAVAMLLWAVEAES